MSKAQATWITESEAKWKGVSWWTVQGAGNSPPARQLHALGPDEKPVLRYPNGDMYWGGWKRCGFKRNFRPVGYGVYLSHDGLVVAGPWQNGKLQGTAVQAYIPSAEIWQDNCDNNSSIQKDGTRVPFAYFGKHVNSRRCDSRGMVVLKDGTCYRGQWKDGRPVGNIWTDHTKEPSIDIQKLLTLERVNSTSARDVNECTTVLTNGTDRNPAKQLQWQQRRHRHQEVDMHRSLPEQTLSHFNSDLNRLRTSGRSSEGSNTRIVGSRSTDFQSEASGSSTVAFERTNSSKSRFDHSILSVPVTITIDHERVSEFETSMWRTSLSIKRKDVASDIVVGSNDDQIPFTSPAESANCSVPVQINTILDPNEGPISNNSTYKPSSVPTEVRDDSETSLPLQDLLEYPVDVPPVPISIIGESQKIRGPTSCETPRALQQASVGLDHPVFVPGVEKESSSKALYDGIGEENNDGGIPVLTPHFLGNSAEDLPFGQEAGLCFVFDLTGVFQDSMNIEFDRKTDDGVITEIKSTETTADDPEDNKAKASAHDPAKNGNKAPSQRPLDTPLPGISGAPPDQALSLRNTERIMPHMMGSSIGISNIGQTVIVSSNRLVLAAEEFE